MASILLKKMVLGDPVDDFPFCLFVCLFVQIYQKILAGVRLPPPPLFLAMPSLPRSWKLLLPQYVPNWCIIPKLIRVGLFNGWIANSDKNLKTFSFYRKWQNNDDDRVHRMRSTAVCLLLVAGPLMLIAPMGGLCYCSICKAQMMMIKISLI